MARIRGKRTGDDRDPLVIALGQVIQTRRKRLGLSQEELAARTGVHRTYVGALERGEYNPTVTVLFRLARSLDAWPDELLSECRITSEVAVTTPDGDTQ